MSGDGTRGGASQEPGVRWLKVQEVERRHRAREGHWLRDSRAHRGSQQQGKNWVEQPGKMCQSAQARMMGRDEGAERSHQWPWQDLTLIRGVCRKFGMLWGAKFYVDYTQ